MKEKTVKKRTKTGRQDGKKNASYWKVVNHSLTTTLIWRICLLAWCFILFMSDLSRNEWKMNNADVITMLIFCSICIFLISMAVAEIAVTIYKAKKETNKSHKEKYLADVIYQSFSITPEVYNVLIEWKNEAHVKFLMIKRKRTEEGETLILYTDRPGAMIGRAGEMVDKYKKMLKSSGYLPVVDVEFVEVSGCILANEPVQCDKFYSEDRYWGEEL